MGDGNSLEVHALIPSRHFRVIGDIDLATASSLEQSLEPTLAEPGALTLDVTELEFIDSSGIRVLVRMGLRLGGAPLILLRPKRQVRRALDITGVAQGGHIEVRDTDCCTHG